MKAYISRKLSISPEFDSIEDKSAMNIFGILLPIIFLTNFIVMISIYPDLNPLILSNAILICTIAVIFLLLFFFTTVRFSSVKVLVIYLAVATVIFYYSSIMTFQSGISLYYLPLLSTLSTVYQKNSQKNYKRVIIVYTVVLFLISHFFDFSTYYEEYQINTLEDRMRILTFILCFMLVSASLYSSFQINSYHSELYYKSIADERLISELKISTKSNVKKNEQQLLNAAQNNNSEFIIHFKLLYPQFMANLIAKQPALTNELFRLCIYLKLGFSTNEIAAITFRTGRSIQTKKNRLRKLYDLGPEVDLYDWIKNYD